MQTWCECDCDPETAEIDEALNPDSAFDYHEPDGISIESDEDDDDWGESSEPVVGEDVCIHGIPWDTDCEDCDPEGVGSFQA